MKGTAVTTAMVGLLLLLCAKASVSVRHDVVDSGESKTLDGVIDVNKFIEENPGKLEKMISSMFVQEKEGVTATEGTTVVNDSKFTSCDAAVAGPEHPLLINFRTKYKLAFDIGDYVVGISDMRLSKVIANAKYEHGNLMSTLEVNGEGTTQKRTAAQTCGNIRVRPARINVVLKGVRVESKVKGSFLRSMLDEIDLPSVVLTTEVIVAARGKYNKDASHVEGRTIFDVEDLPEYDKMNDISVCLYNLKHYIKSTSVVLNGLIDLFDTLLNGISPRVKDGVGKFVKCWMRQGQASFFESVIYMRTMEQRQKLAVMGDCKNRLEDCEKIIKSSLGVDKVVETEFPYALRTVKQDLETEGEPHFKVHLNAEGVYDGDDAKGKSDMDSHIHYKALISMKTFTSDVVNTLLLKGEDLLNELNGEGRSPKSPTDSDDDASSTSSGSDIEVNEDTTYLKSLLHQFLSEMMIDTSDLLALITYFKHSTLDEDTKLQFVAKKFSLLVDGKKRGVCDAEVNARRAAVALHIPSDSKFPLDLILRSYETRRVDEYIIEQCREYFPDHFAKCVSRGRVECQDLLALSSAKMKELYNQAKHVLGGKVTGSLQRFQFTGPLDAEFWKLFAQTRCDVRDTECQDMIGLFGRYLVDKSSFFRLQTEDIDDENGLGIRIDKKIVALGLTQEFEGPMNLGKIMGVILNTRDYLNQALAEKKSIDMLRKHMKESNSKLKDIESAAGWRRPYADDLGKFLKDETMAGIRDGTIPTPKKRRSPRNSPKNSPKPPVGDDEAHW